MRRHRVPQTTSQQGLQRASWSLHRDCLRPSDAAEAAVTGARRADRCVHRSIGDSPSMHNTTVARQRRGLTTLIRDPGVASWHAVLGPASQTHCVSEAGR